MSGDQRLYDYVDDATRVGHPEDDPVGDSGHYDEPDVDQEDGDEPCVECGAADAVQNPQEEVSTSLPPEPRCRVCLMEHA